MEEKYLKWLTQSIMGKHYYYEFDIDDIRQCKMFVSIGEKIEVNYSVYLYCTTSGKHLCAFSYKSETNNPKIINLLRELCEAHNVIEISTPQGECGQVFFVWKRYYYPDSKARELKEYFYVYGEKVSGTYSDIIDATNDLSREILKKKTQK